MNYNTNQRRSINNVGLLGGLAAVAGYTMSLSSLTGCNYFRKEEKKIETPIGYEKECEPDTDMRFKDITGLVTQKSADKETMKNYLETLITKINSEIVKKEKDKNDGIVFIKYKISDEPLSEQKIIEVLEEGLVRGKELSNTNFEVYSTSDKWFNSIKVDEEFYQSIPMNVTGTSTMNVTGTPINEGSIINKYNVNIGDLEVKRTYNDKNAVLVVDLKENRVLGLYAINENDKNGIIKFVECKSLILKNLTTLLNNDLYEHSDKLDESVIEIFGAGIYGSIDETNKQLGIVGKSKKYLFDIKVNIGAAKDCSNKLNDDKISLVTLNQIITGEFTRTEFEVKNFENRFPVFKGNKNRSYSLELFVDKNGKTKSKIIQK